MKRIIYLVCIHLLCSTAAQASNLRQISSREGISNNAILSLAQDKHGFIWVGSCDGLNMWDGERMRLFPNDWGEYTPLSGNLIEEIAVTTDSLFWIRTNYGLDLFDPDSKHVEPHTCFQGMYRVVTRSSDEVIVITRSNKRANRYNEGIRRYILSAEEEIESGDMLMVVKNNYHYATADAQGAMNFIANGDIARLVRLRRFEDFYGFHFADAVLSFADYGDMEIGCKILLDTIKSESPSLTREESNRLFYEVEKDYVETKSKIKRYKEIRENPHFNAVQVKFAYAVTCHKAQGGQWRAVFVDRCLFGDEPMTRDMLRWLYTALTRATEKLYLVNFDPRFYE